MLNNFTGILNDIPPFQCLQNTVVLGTDYFLLWLKTDKNAVSVKPWMKMF